MLTKQWTNVTTRDGWRQRTQKIVAVGRAAAGVYDLSFTAVAALAALPLAVYGLYALLIVLPLTRSAAVWALREDHPVEVLTFFLFLAGGLYGLALAWQLHRQGAHRFVTGFYTIFSLAMLFVAMEEISWGQWPFNYSTPAAVAEINLQGEMTLHNLALWRTHLEVFPLTFGLCGLLGIWLGRRPFWRHVAPPVLLLPWYVLIAVFSAVDLVQDFTVIQPQFDRLVDYLDELLEMLVGASGLLLVWLNGRRLARHWPGLTDALTRASLSGRLNNLIHSLTARASTRLFSFLLALDAVLIVLHLLYLAGAVSDPAFAIDLDQGYAELFQYAKMLGIVLLLALLAQRWHAPAYFHWIWLFLYLLLDDALMIHESVGRILMEAFNLPAVAGLRAQDFGELLVYAAVGLLFLTTLTLTYQRSDRPARELSLSLVLLVLAFGFFSVVLDLVQHTLRPPFLFELVGLIEDGGEHVVISVIAWFLFVRAGRALGEEDAAAAWVNVIVAGATLFLLFILSLSFVQWGTAGLAGNDGYYHARMGLLVRQQGLRPAPPQLPFTVLNEADFYDHHLLYHVYLALFAATDPAVDGGIALTQSAKTASVILPALAFLAVWWLLRGQAVPWPWLWALVLLALSEGFLYRISMPRTQAASLLVLVLALHWLLHQRYHLLLPLGFMYVWLYNAFPLLLLVAGVYCLATFVTERRFAWPALAYPATGILLGMLINPYFPRNLVFAVHHLGAKLWLSDTPVGIEWYPYDTWTLVEVSAVALALYWLATLALAWRGRRLDGRTLTLFLLTAVFGLMLLKSRRFIEYWPPFVLIFAALSLSPLLVTWSQTQWWRRRWLSLGLALLLLLPLLLTLRATRIAMTDSLPADQYAAAALWLRAYSEPGSVIFQTDWDDFPRLFFYDSDQVYTVGLDPTYMERYDPDLYRSWVQVTRGQANAPGLIIQKQFGADYVFSDLEHEAFLEQAAADPYLQEIYRDTYAVIFAVAAP